MGLATATGCLRAPNETLDREGGVGTIVAASAPVALLTAPPKAPLPVVPPTATEAGSCPGEGNEDKSVGLVISPLRAVAGAPLRVLAATLKSPEQLAIRIETAKGELVQADTIYRGGTPAMTVARLVPKTGGVLRVVVGRGGTGMRCASVHVFDRSAPTRARRAREKAVWPVARTWSGAEEALYSAWVREMFHAPRGEELAFARLDAVTSNRERNVLFDHFGWAEDSTDKALSLKPDCADTPYFLRAYFAWKRALPFAYRHCSSGDETSPPRCGKPRTTLEPPDLPSKLPVLWNELTQVARFFPRSLGEVHTGNTRVPFDDDENDFYALELSRRALRPGAVYADPYGHVYSVVEFMEPEGSLPGVLYAVDGQPDGSITRKRFWEGNFMWNPDPMLGGSGFKAFRPLVAKYAEGEQAIASMTDAQIAQHPDYGDVSSAQKKLDANAFYDTMDRLITPSVRDPFAAQEEMVRALAEAAKVRVTSVGNAAPYFAEHPGAVIPLPAGPEIFETTGPWEDFSTPARDLRLLIAMDVVNHFEDKVIRQSAAFGATPGAATETLRQRLAEHRKAMLESDALAFSYERSDGSPRRLTLAELMTRASSFESAYNPNDCPEYRWGARSGDESSTCARRA
ncbi:MAG TPA: hypothetical protein VJT73_20885, partial [Polyangiaceae bacterium]|nr:hypothetical protein [Polyangiaceae bacterium]